MLDNTCLMFLSNLWIGRKHDNTRLPLVLAGGLGGTLKTGRALNYLKDSEDNRKMCSLYLSLMDRFGIKLDTVRRLQHTPRALIVALPERKPPAGYHYVCVAFDRMFSQSSVWRIVRASRSCNTP